MLISNKIKEAIEKEIKTQKNLLKSLETQEANYNVDMSEIKDDIVKSIQYYEKILKEAA